MSNQHRARMPNVESLKLAKMQASGREIVFICADFKYESNDLEQNLHILL